MKQNCLIIIGSDHELEVRSLKDENIDITDWDNFHSFNSEDYDILFFDIPARLKLDSYQQESLLKLGSTELEQIKFVFAAFSSLTISLERYGETIHYIWNEVPKSIKKDGRKIIVNNPNYRLSKLLFKEDIPNFEWYWSIFPENLPENSYVLAKNKKGDIISLVTKINKNYLVILPEPKKKKEIIKYYLENIACIWSELFSKGINFTIEKPGWLEESDPFNKKGLVNDFKIIKEKIKQIELFEKLLYGYDRPLEKSISEIFSYLGFVNIQATNDRADLTCETKTTKIIAEIKGLKDQAHEKNLSQMFKWHLDELEKNEHRAKHIKQIFICNAYRELNPEDRDDFFDENIVKISETHNWGLLSTLELYNALVKVWKKELESKEIISCIEDQSGVIRLQ